MEAKGFAKLYDTLLDRSLATHFISTRAGASLKVKILAATEVVNSLHCLIKKLYVGIFSWIVDSINAYHKSIIKVGCEPVKDVGILDIFGFGKNEYNMVRPLCL